MVHKESHRVDRIGWLRAAVLGANDGIVSTASLVVGVAAASQTPSAILLAGTAGLVAGAMSMAAGEYVSVSSQADAEAADRAKEARELETQPELERRELTRIYEKRGLDRTLASQVAQQMMEHDALGAHLRDELGLSENMAARPVQAALYSAVSFALGAAIPLGAAMLAPISVLIAIVSLVSLVCLAALGAIGARVGGAPIGRAVLRVSFWGAFAIAATAAIGSFFGATIA